MDTPDEVPESLTPSGIIISTFKIYGSIFLVLFVVFLFLRTRFAITFTYNSRVYEHMTPLSEHRFGAIQWIYKIFTFTDEQIFDHCGMAAIVYLRFLRLGFKMSCVGIFNSFYLIPSNLHGCEDDAYDDDAVLNQTVTNKTFCYDLTDPVEKIALGHLSPGSHNVWATTIAAYVMFGAAMYFIFEEFEWFTEFRHKFLTQLRPDNYTVFVSHIPEEYRSDLKLKMYFQKIFGDESVVDARLGRDIKALEHKVAARDKIVEQLEHAVNIRMVKGYEPTHNVSMIPLSVPKRKSGKDDDNNNTQKVLSIPEYCKQLNNINDEIKTQIESVDERRQEEDRKDRTTAEIHVDATDVITQDEPMGGAKRHHHRKTSSISKAFDKMKDSANITLSFLKAKEEGSARDAGFVTFSTLMAANQCVQSIHHASPYVFNTQTAPRPNDIMWANVGISHKEQELSNFFAQVLTLSTCLFWTIPVSFLSSLSEVESLKDLIKGLDKALEKNSWLAPFLAQLKPLLLVVLTALLPMILTFYCKKEGHIGSDTLNASLLTKLAMFLIVQIFFVQTISGSIFTELQAISEEPTSIVNRLAESIPAQVKSFIQFVQVQNFLGCGLELLRIPRVIMAAIRQKIGPNLTEKEQNTPFMGLLPISEPQEMEYPMLFAELILYFMINLVYSCVAPIMSYILIIAFIILNVVFRHQLIYTYSRANDDGGKLFGSAIQLLVTCMLISEVTLIGIILLKKGYIAGGLLVPLIICTALFFSYIKKRHFLVTEYAPTTLCECCCCCCCCCVL
jgi:hypothetical protein